MLPEPCHESLKALKSPAGLSWEQPSRELAAPQANQTPSQLTHAPNRALMSPKMSLSSAQLSPGQHLSGQEQEVSIPGHPSATSIAAGLQPSDWESLKKLI